jgi:hypothetical protein
VIQTDLLNATGHPSTWVRPCTTRVTGKNRAIDNRRFVRALRDVPRPALRELAEKLRRLGEL